MGNFIELTCPFCAEREFDAIGLKHHLLNGWCDAFEQTAPIVAEIIGSPYKAVETNDGLWNAYGNDGMRHMEASDVIDGETDAAGGARKLRQD